VKLRGTLPEVFNLCILGGQTVDTDFIFSPVPQAVYSTETKTLHLPFRNKDGAA
jgi:hypothetical protein